MHRNEKYVLSFTKNVSLTFQRGLLDIDKFSLGFSMTYTSFPCNIELEKANSKFSYVLSNQLIMRHIKNLGR